MANVNAPFGLRPCRHLAGGKITANEYTIASEYATSIYEGDVVEMSGSGRNVEKAAAQNADNIGVFAGCRYVNAQGKQVFSKYWPASTVATDIVCWVYDDPNIVFETQISTIASGDVGNLVDWHVGTGSTVTGVSGLYANGATKATENAALRILKLKESPDNAYGAYAKIEVIFAEHVLKGVVAGVGGV